MATEIEQLLTAALSPVRLEVVDDSAKHRGHAGHDPRGESHFSVTIVSSRFQGQSRVARQRLVNHALAELLQERVHALAIKALAPGENRMSDLFTLAITPATHDLGGFKVRRTLPSQPRTMVGPFIFVDQFGPAQLDPGQGMDVRPHPHINLATVTYLFEGAIDHRDSVGTVATITPGAVNLMTAGRGIVHSERTPAAVRQTGAIMSGMQTWLALPDGKEEIDPAFEHIPAGDLPMIEGGGVSARIIMGAVWGRTAPTTCHAQTIYADIQLQPGASVPIDAAADERAVMVALGDATLDGEPLALYTLYLLKPGVPMTLRSAGGGRVMLLGGEAFTTPRHVWWNFVSSSRDRINQAKHDWKAGRFPPVPDEHEFIPLPEVPLTVSYP